MKIQKIAGVVVVALMSLSVLRGAVPNEDDIIAQIASNRSDNYYPNLMLRYEMGDSTLTLDNYHYLYYGYAYDSRYKPLSTNPYMDKFLLLASGLDIEKPNVEIIHELIAVGDKVLESDPFNLKVWNMLAYAYETLGEYSEAEAAYRRVEMIIATIKASGSGLKQSSPQHILMFDHALDVMAADNLIHKKAMVVSRTVEYIPLLAPIRVDNTKVKGVYFDFERVYWNRPDSVTYKRDRTWQFNNLKPREY